MVSERDVAARLRRLAALLSVGQVAALADKLRDQYVPVATQRAEGTNNQHLLDYVHKLDAAAVKLTSIQQNLGLAAEALNSYSEASEEDKGLGPNFTGLERNPKRPLSGEKPKAKGSTDERQPADLGPRWKAESVDTITFGNFGCERIAEKIQKKIGGEIREISSANAAYLGPYRDRNPEWRMHQVVIKNGRVYDAWTGRYGATFEEYKKLWLYEDVIDFPFGE